MARRSFPATAGKRGRRGCMINGPVTGPKSLPADLPDIIAEYWEVGN